MEARTVWEVDAAHICLKPSKTIKMIHNGWKEFFIKFPKHNSVRSLFLLCLMQFSMIFVFLISLDSSLETHKAEKCFKKENIQDKGRALSLVRWHSLWETTVLSFFHLLHFYCFCHMRKKHNTRKNQVIIFSTSQHHWLVSLDMSCVHFNSGWPAIFCTWVLSCLSYKFYCRASWSLWGLLF